MIFQYSKWKLLYEFIRLLLFNFLFLFLAIGLIITEDNMIVRIISIVYLLLVVKKLFEKIVEVFYTKVVFDENGVRINSGLFLKMDHFIPIEKFQNVQTTASLLQRIFKVQKIVLETGEESNDLHLNFVSEHEKKQIEQIILLKGKVTDSDIELPTTTTILRLPTKSLIKASFYNFVFIFLPVGIIFTLQTEPTIFFTDSEVPLWAKLVVPLIFLFIVLCIASIHTFNRNAHYEVSLDDESIYVQRGWFNKKTFSIRKKRIQSIVYKQNLYQKLLNTVTVQISSAGEVTESNSEQMNDLFPYLSWEEANKIVAQFAPAFICQPMHEKAAKESTKLIWRKPPVVGLLIFILGYWHFAFYILAGLFTIYTYLSRWLTIKNLRYSINGSLLQARTGSFVTKTVVTTRNKCIQCSSDQSILHKPLQLYRITLSTRTRSFDKTELNAVNEQEKHRIEQWFSNRSEDIKYEYPKQ